MFKKQPAPPAPSASAEAACGKLGIIAGSGDLPLRLIEACKTERRELFVVAFKDETDERSTVDTEHVWITHNDIPQTFELLRKAGVKELVLAGRISRPSLSSLRPTLLASRLFAHIGHVLMGGDNALFTALVGYIESEGFKVIGADDVLKDLLTPEGALGRVLPTQQSQKDIELGAKVAIALGALDIGQAVVVKNGQVLGVEAIEGTDLLIHRCAGLGAAGIGGVLVKAKKPGQERRVDLPTIGPTTVEMVHDAGFAGIALEAGGTLIIDRQQVIQQADALGLFLIGFTRMISTHG